MLSNKLTGVKRSILALAFASAYSELRFAADTANAPSGDTLPKGNGGEKPATSFQAKRQVVHPVLDIDSMSEDQVREALKRLQSQQRSTGMTRTFRFNDGSEATYYAEGDKILDERGRPTGKTATGTEVKSARDSGTISVYGFNRNPISLYPNQLLELLWFGQELATFIRDNVEHINGYLRKRNKGDASNDVNIGLAEQLIETFEAPLELVTLRGQIKAYDPDLLEMLTTPEAVEVVEATEDDPGIVHSVEIADAEAG